MRSTTQMILSLAPDSLSAALVRRGKVLQAESIDLDPGRWNELWSGNMMRLDQPLRQLMSRFSARTRGSATLVYHSPTLTKQVHSFDLQPAQSKDAAITKIRESIGPTDPVEVSSLTGNHRSAKATTTLAFSEHEEPLRALYAWLNRCGIKVDSMVPISVAVIQAATSIASSVDPDTAVFYIDSDVSVMVYNCEGQLRLVRPADIGYRKLTEAYAQPFSKGLEKGDGSDQEKADHNIDLAVRATGMLFKHGIPMQSIEIDGADLRTTVFPYLAPVLQRICIDVKQTMRFGLDSSHQPKNLMICGPGAHIPGLSKAIAQHIDLHIKTEPGAEGYEPTKAFGRGTVEWFMVDSRSTPTGLLPEIAHDAKARAVLNSGLIAGAAVVAIALGGELAFTSVQQQELNKQSQSQAPRLAVVNSFHDECDSVSKVSTIISDVSSLVTSSIVTVPDWHHLLADLGDFTGERIRVQELRGEYAAGAATIEINGIAVAGSDADAGRSLDEFVGAIEAMDRVRSVNLGATSRVSVDNHHLGRQFSMRVVLKTDPPPYAAYAHAETQSSTKGKR